MTSPAMPSRITELAAGWRYGPMWRRILLAVVIGLVGGWFLQDYLVAEKTRKPSPTKNPFTTRFEYNKKKDKLIALNAKLDRQAVEVRKIIDRTAYAVGTDDFLRASELSAKKSGVVLTEIKPLPAPPPRSGEQVPKGNLRHRV